MEPMSGVEPLTYLREILFNCAAKNACRRCVFRQVDLPPSAVSSQLPNPLAACKANVTRRPYYRRVNPKVESTLACGSK